MWNDLTYHSERFWQTTPPLCRQTRLIHIHTHTTKSWQDKNVWLPIKGTCSRFHHGLNRFLFHTARIRQTKLTPFVCLSFVLHFFSNICYPYDRQQGIMGYVCCVCFKEMMAGDRQTGDRVAWPLSLYREILSLLSLLTGDPITAIPMDGRYYYFS